MTASDINILFSLEDPCTLRKKTLENAFFTKIVNYGKIIQKNKLCYPKKQQIGYLMTNDVTYSVLALIEKLPFFNEQL